MLRFLATLALCLTLPVVAACQTVSQDVAKTPSGTYRIDPGHTQVLFAISHLGLTDYYGRFDKISGTMAFDSTTPEKSSVSVSIDTTSVDTPSRAVTDELQSTLGTEKFPAATFVSTSVVKTGPATGRVTGTLTLKGVAKPVTIDVVFSGGATNLLTGRYSLGFHGTTIIKRSDFGLTGMIWAPFVGDDVKLIIEAMLAKENA
jgi:polyisoprenoid-binding protein YceI